MSSRPEIEESSLSKSLARIDRYLARLQQLPPASEFTVAVEQDMWETVTEQPDPPAEVQYVNLPARAHSLIGMYEDKDGPTEPWWLREFDWTASFGGEEIVLRGDSLETFAENFDRDRTVMHQPELRSSLGYSSVRDGFDALKDIQSELEERIDPASNVSFPTLPDSLFAVEDGLVEPTDMFSEWIDGFLSLVPGIGPEATALYLAHTGTSREAAESALDEELFEKVDRVVTFRYPKYQPMMVDKFDTVLELSRIFNRVIPVEEPHDDLSGLQYQLYRGFLETFEPKAGFVQEMFNTATRQRPATLDASKKGLFTRVACGTPLIWYGDGRPKLMSVAMYSPKSNDSGYKEEGYRDVRALFEEYGWFNDA